MGRKREREEGVVWLVFFFRLCKLFLRGGQTVFPLYFWTFFWFALCFCILGFIHEMGFLVLVSLHRSVSPLVTKSSSRWVFYEE